MNRKNSNITLRLAELKEAAAVADLLYQSFVAYKGLYTEMAFQATTLSTSSITARIHDRIIWVGFYADVLSATVSLLPIDDVMYIKSVAVVPVARRNGLGKELMNHAERDALKRNIYSLELTTTPFLFEAIKLYESAGFRKCGNADLFGTQLIKMQKNLKPVMDALGKPVELNFQN